MSCQYTCQNTQHIIQESQDFYWNCRAEICGIGTRCLYIWSDV